MSDALMQDSDLTRRIVRHRWWLFGAIALVYLLAFNGQWHITPDSALYRDLGHSIASGQGYTFRGEPHKHAYPGLPLMLGGLEYLFGQSAVPPVLAVLALSIATLVLVYKLVSLHYPPWVAVSTTALIGLSATMHRYTGKILTDIPFLFAACLTLYAFGRFRLADSPRRYVMTAATLIGGLAIAVSMRPTGWLLIAALVGACLWGLFVGPRRLSAMCIAVVCAITIAWLVLDPRTGPFEVLGGVYERRVARALTNPNRPWTIDRLFEEHLPEAVFGDEMGPGINTILCILVIIGGLTLLRRNVASGLFVIATLSMSMVLASLTRYLVMILPLLMLGWIVLWANLAGRLGGPRGDRLLAAALLVVLGPNVARCGKVILDQRAVPFLEHFEDGRWRPHSSMAAVLREHVAPGSRIVGPDARVLTYLSGRWVYDGDRFLPFRYVGSAPILFEKHGAKWAMLPPNMYKENSVFRGLVEKGVVAPVGAPIIDGDWSLTRVELRMPKGDWRKLPAIDPPRPSSIAGGDETR